MLHTNETLVAVFPDYNQNRGIIRSIPTQYDGHSTHITVKSVTDGDGKPRSFSMGTDGDFTTITIAVPEGQYVHGRQSYVIDYTQTDVTSTSRTATTTSSTGMSTAPGGRSPSAR